MLNADELCDLVGEDLDMEREKNTILSAKDKKIDTFLFAVLEKIQLELETEFEVGEQHSEEYQKRFEEVANHRLNGMSIMLGNKLGGVLKNYLDQYYSAQNVSSFGRIKLPKKDLKSFSLDYGVCFSSWVHSPYVSYQCTNRVMLGGLSMVHSFILHLWSFLVCYRSRGDNMFALSICGKSSVGKSVIFENVLFENGFNFNGEAGVGRYDTKAKSILIYHDINIRVLASGKNDAEKFKTISRSERTNAKVHSTVKTVPALFVVVTSNMRIHTHHIKGKTWGNFLCDTHPSELIPPKSTGKDNESVEAVKNRVLEAYCSARPTIDPACFPTSGFFTRKNFILGVYGQVLDILEQYRFEEFYSVALLMYILCGLTDNARFYCKVMDDGPQRMQQLQTLLLKFCQTESEYDLYLEKLPLVVEKHSTEVTDTSTPMPEASKDSWMDY